MMAWWTTTRSSAPHSPTATPVEAAPNASTELQPTRKSAAVLPFVNMSSDKENEYFSDGITEDLITALSQVSRLHVAARTSSFACKGKNETIENSGQQRHVGGVLEGSVATAGNQVRITAQLANTADGYHRWSAHYDRDLKAIFAIRSEVAQTVAEALLVTLGAGERQIIEHQPTEDLEAYPLYLKGRRAAATFNDFTTAAHYLQQAIARDPGFALAYSGMAYYYWGAVEWLMPGSEALPRMREAAEKAPLRDPSLAEAHTWLGVVHWQFDRDYAAAERELQTAIKRQTELASAHWNYGWSLAGAGRFEEGIAGSYRAVELDPLAVDANIVQGINRYLAQRYAEAIHQLRIAVSVDPDH